MTYNRLARVFISTVLGMAFLAVPAENARALPFITPADNYSVATRPVFVAAGDFNRDGWPDLAVANSGSNNISILLNDGDGTYTIAGPVSVGTTPRSIAVGDFNRDGWADLAVADYGSGHISILLGTGPGTFGKTDFAAGKGPDSISIGDFDRDGILDLAAANYSDSTVSILLGTGSGGFGTKTDFETGANPYSVVVGDFNSDGKPDLATANYTSNNVSILLGDGLGTFGTKTDLAAGNGAHSVAVGDFNRDGVPDLAAANFSSNNISILLNTAPPAGLLYQEAVNYAVVTNPTSVAVGDFDRDGKPDLVVANYDDGSDNISMLLGTVSGTFIEAPGFPMSWNAEPISVAVGDFDRNGKPDLAVAEYAGGNVSILLGDGSGIFTKAAGSPVPVGMRPSCIAVGDFNRDGDLDLVTTSDISDNVFIVLGDGNGGFTNAIPATDSTGSGSRPTSVTTGDFDRDGVPDLAVANYNSGTIAILLGTGSGSFSLPAVPYPAGTWPDSVAMGDFDRDGVPDLAVANYGSDNVSVLTGTGTGTFDPAKNFTVGADPVFIIVGDFNVDGKLDLATANSSSNNISILRGDGNGTFGTAVNYPVGTNPGSITMGDFNRDGKPDLAVANHDSNNVSILNSIVAPTVATLAATSIMATTAILHGDLTNTGGTAADIAIFSGTTEGTWTRSDNFSITAAGPFSLGVKGLAPGTIYHYRCYAENGAGGNWAPSSISFTTQADLGLWKNYWAGPGTDGNWFSSGPPTTPPLPIEPVTLVGISVVLEERTMPLRGQQ